MNYCPDEGTIQSFLDHELPAPDVHGVGSHLETCEACAGAAREARCEWALLTRLFAHDLSLPVPSERLWMRISNALTSELPAAR